VQQLQARTKLLALSGCCVNFCTPSIRGMLDVPSADADADADAPPLDAPPLATENAEQTCRGCGRCKMYPAAHCQLHKDAGWWVDGLVGVAWGDGDPCPKEGLLSVAVFENF